MTSFISHTALDCGNAYELSTWWKQVLEYVDKPDDPNERGHVECWIQRPDGGHPLLFIEVPEGKQVKNRIHLDLRPSAGTREEELQRLLDLGAQQVEHGPAVRVDESGPGPVVHGLNMPLQAYICQGI